MNYSELVDSYIKKSGLSLAEIAKRMKEEKGIKIDRSYISKLRNDPKYPATEEINRALAEITGGDAESLVMAGYYEKAPIEVKKNLDKASTYDRFIEYLIKNRPIKGDFNNSELSENEIEQELSYLNSPDFLTTLSHDELQDIFSEVTNHMIINNPEVYLETMKDTPFFKFLESNKDRLHLLKKLREVENLTPKEMAYAFGITEKDYLVFEEMASIIDYSKPDSVERIYTAGINEMKNKLLENTTPYLTSSMARVPVLGSIRAGQPIDRIEYNEGYTLVDPELLRGRIGFALRVKGDSMSGDRILDGDIVVVLKQDEVQPNDIAVVAINGDEATLKRVKHHGEMVMLVPSNPAYEPKLLPANDVIIIGKVVEVKFWPK